MAEYIERKALIAEINLQKKSSKTSYPKRSFVVGDVLTCIYTAPAADVAPVVRCKDCENHRWYTNRYGVEISTCTLLCVDIKPDDFCSYGERRGE